MSPFLLFNAPMTAPTELHFAPELSFPPDAVTQTFGFLGRRGSGKTYAAGKLAEELVGVGAQIVVLDPVGAWWGLRLDEDGKSPGISIPVFGGLRGDVPLVPTSGALVARLVVERGISAILDVSAMRKGERKRFATEFAEELFHAKKSSRSPVHLFLEEAQVFVPQRTIAGEEPMLGAFEDLVKLGRNFGIGVSLISQRPQSVNKDALNQTECLVVLQTNGSQERKAIEAWIVEQGLDIEKLVRDLPSLAPGVAWVWSPSWLRVTKKVHVSKKATFDASSTPKLGSRKEPARPLAPVDLEAISKAMSATIQEADAKDPIKLRARIKDLEKSNAQMQRELQMKSDLRPAPTKTKPAMTEADWKRLERFVARISAAKVDVEKFFGDWRIAIDGIAAKLAPARDREAILPIARSWTGIPGVPIVQKPVRILVERARGDIGQGKLDGNGTDLPRGARAMLASVVAFGSLDRQSIATLSGLASSGGTFLKYLSMLKTGGYLVSDDGEKFIPGGVNVGLIGGDGPPSDKRELVALWSHLPAGARAMLEVVVSREVVSRSELGELANIEPNGGTFAKYASMLVSAGLVERSGGSFKLSATMEMLP